MGILRHDATTRRTWGCPNPVEEAQATRRTNVYTTGSTPEEAIWGGIIAFGVCSIWGLRLLLRGIRGEILDSSGHAVASRDWFIGGGIFLQLPLIGFLLFAWKQGFFGS